MLAGRSQRDFKHMNLFPYAPHLAFWLAHHAGLGFGTFMLSTGGGKTLAELEAAQPQSQPATPAPTP